jgi:hypothetical protein
MIAEGSSPHAPVPGGGPPEPGEPDLLAERRARRIAEPSTEAALLRRAEAAEATVRTLETHVASLQQRLRDSEGDTRLTRDLAERMERLETAVEAIRESHRRMAVTVGELRNLAVKLRVAAERQPEPANGRREEMAVALAAAVERLRARAEQSQQPDAQAQPPAVEESQQPDAQAQAQPPVVEESQQPDAQAPAVEQSQQHTAAEPSPPDQAQAPSPEPAYGIAPAAPVKAAEPAPELRHHKHSMSLIGRLLNRRKQRKSR